MTQYGEQHHGAKLTYEQARAIFDRCDGLYKTPGWKQLRYELAREFAVSIHTIDRIAGGVSWVEALKTK